MDASSSTTLGSGGRRRRFATLYCLVSAMGFFAVLQAGLILVSEQSFDVAAAVGLAKLGVVAALVTVGLLAGLVVAVRRLHLATRRGDRALATRSMMFGSVAALSTWMIVDAWVAGPLVPPGFEVWVELVATAGIGWAVARRPPSEAFCRKSSPLLVLALAVLFLPMPGDRPPRTDEAKTAEDVPSRPRDPSPDQPDVVLISIDTFRADRVGAYGSSRSLTPEIDRFAAEGFVFERVLAPAPWTVPSVASMLTGLPTIRHRAGLPLGSGSAFLRTPLRPDAVTVAERFSAAGYRTRAVVANGFLSPEMGMARGFEEYDLPFSRATGGIFVRSIPLARLLLAIFPVESWADYRAAGVTDRGLEMLAGPGDGPLFLWLHYIDPHTPFQADPSAFDLDAWGSELRQIQPRVRADGTVVGDVFAGTSHVRGGTLWLSEVDRGRIESYYDRAVTYVDGELGRLFDALRRRSEERGVVVALTSDHGEELWEHGHFEHGHDYYREVTRIPLILWGRDRVPVGRSGQEPVGLVDLAPTLLELAGLEAPDAELPDDGRSLTASWSSSEGSADPEPSSARIRFCEGNLYGIPSVLLEEGPWRFILRTHGAVELYHAIDDPNEVDNRAALNPELVARYRALAAPRLAQLQELGDEAPELDAETRRALRSLGYVQ